ncbi:hypothetical protein, partial [Streptomyces eurythermus]|uniref:hypothetical protein n=1 Tax=Streptomyces eurythermus TaxID=42237 RepID=UPI0033D3FC0A
MDSTSRRSPLSGIEAHPASSATPKAAHATARPGRRRAPPTRFDLGTGDALVILPPDQTDLLRELDAVFSG